MRGLSEERETWKDAGWERRDQGEKAMEKKGEERLRRKEENENPPCYSQF